MTPQPPGCCGDTRCQGCAWECDRDDGHDYQYDPSLEVSVCQHCDNESPSLAAAVTRPAPNPKEDRMTEQPCPFCEIAAGRAPATIVHEWPEAIAIIPLNPVVQGHVLVIPREHVRDFTDYPKVSAATMLCAAELVAGMGSYNLITSKGRAATQSVMHLHLHLLPRAEDDGLALPWYSGKKSTGMQLNIRPKPDDDGFARGFAAGRRTR